MSLLTKIVFVGTVLRVGTHTKGALLHRAVSLCSLPRMPTDLVKERERKWLKMIAKWDYYMEKKPRKVRAGLQEMA